MKSSDALIKFTEERINTNKQLAEFVQRAAAVTIPIFPETVQFTEPSLKFGAAIVSVNTELDKYGNNSDIYKNETGSYCLHLRKLNEIAQQAGLQIIDSRILERKTDENGKVTYIEHQVKGKLKSVDGSVKEATLTGKYDYFRDLDKYTSEKQIKSRRSHAEALAESNAITRLINKLIAKLPSNFSIKELEKPFLIPYVIEDKNEYLKGLPIEDQRAIKKQVAMKAMGLVDTIYSPLAGSEHPQTNSQVEEAEVITTEEEKKPIFTPEEENHLAAETYREVPEAELTDKIINLLKLKQHDFGEITRERIEKNSLDKRIQFLEKLLNLPDRVEELPL